MSPGLEVPVRVNAALLALPGTTLVRVERYSHGGYLIKVVVIAVAGEVARELSPILSWSNNNYEI